MPSEGPQKNSLVVPVFGNQENLLNLFRELSTLARGVEGGLEVVFVVDGSPDDSISVIRSFKGTSPFEIQIIEHSRNFGSFAAIITGFEAATGSYLAVMAADSQEPIELIQNFFDVLKNAEADIAVGARVGRRDSFFGDFASGLFWKSYRLLVEPSIPPGGVDVFACTREVAQVLVKLPEANSSLIGLLYWVGFSRIEIEYTRKPRKGGKTGWTFSRKFRYLSDSVFSFTSLPITLILITGAMGSLAALVLGIAVFVGWLSGDIIEPGYTSLVLVQLASTAAVLLGLGIIGTYVWRTFDNTKRRPNSIVKEPDGAEQ